MTAWERDAMTLPLAWAAGATDAMSYIALGHVFTANMTGNVVLLGIAISSGRPQEMLPILISLLSYVIGVAAGGVIAQNATKTRLWPPRTTVTFAVEGIILLGIAVAWFFADPRPAGAERHMLAACAAFSLGMQSAAMWRLKVPGIVTTYITGTLTTLVLSAEKPARQKSENRDEWEERIALPIMVIAIYLFSAVVTALVLTRWGRGIAITPALMVLFVAVYSGVRRKSRDSAAAAVPHASESQ